MTKPKPQRPSADDQTEPLGGAGQEGRALDEKDLYGGLIKLHVLHHAVHEPVFGFAMMEELARHGYFISAGTLYPMLHGMERRGYLVSHVRLLDGRRRRLYTATPFGKRALRAAKIKVRELFGELFEEEPARMKSRGRHEGP